MCGQNNPWTLATNIFVTQLIFCLAIHFLVSQLIISSLFVKFQVLSKPKLKHNLIAILRLKNVHLFAQINIFSKNIFLTLIRFVFVGLKIEILKASTKVTLTSISISISLESTFFACSITSQKSPYHFYLRSSSYAAF